MSAPVSTAVFAIAEPVRVARSAISMSLPVSVVAAAVLKPNVALDVPLLFTVMIWLSPALLERITRWESFTTAVQDKVASAMMASLTSVIDKAPANVTVTSDCWIPSMVSCTTSVRPVIVSVLPKELTSPLTCAFRAST